MNIVHAIGMAATLFHSRQLGELGICGAHDR